MSNKPPSLHPYIKGCRDLSATKDPAWKRATMATHQPATLPISSTQIPSSAPSASPLSATTTPAFRAFISKFSDSVKQSLSHRRPWSELIDRSAFSKPESLSEATARLRKNYTYFRINYALLLASVLAVSLVTHPISLLFLVLLLASWLFLYLLRPSDSPVMIFGRQFSDREMLLGLVGLTVVVIFLTSVGSLLISALMVGFGIVALHGAFRVPEDLFLDEQEPVASGFLSFLGGAASAATAPVVSRV